MGPSSFTVFTIYTVLGLSGPVPAPRLCLSGFAVYTIDTVYTVLGSWVPRLWLAGFTFSAVSWVIRFIWFWGSEVLDFWAPRLHGSYDSYGFGSHRS